jgi:hypothetical protein
MNKTDIISALCSCGTFGYGVYLLLVNGVNGTTSELIKAGLAVVLGFIFSCVYGLPLLKGGWTSVDNYFKNLAENMDKPKPPVVEPTVRVEDKKPEPAPVENKVEPVIEPEVKVEEKMAKEDKINDGLEMLLAEFADNTEAVSHIKALFTIHLEDKINKITKKAVVVDAPQASV